MTWNNCASDPAFEGVWLLVYCQTSYWMTRIVNETILLHKFFGGRNLSHVLVRVFVFSWNPFIGKFTYKSPNLCQDFGSENNNSSVRLYIFVWNNHLWFLKSTKTETNKHFDIHTIFYRGNNMIYVHFSRKYLIF